MTEKEKSAAGLLYAPSDPELFAACQNAKRLCHEINMLAPCEMEKRAALLRELLGGIGEKCYMEPPVYFDYGYNTFIGDYFYSNHNFCVLDCARVQIGDHVFIGPNVSLYPPAHPLDAATRNAGLEAALPITIGNNVWIGGSVCILPGVTIGDNSVIGAGSVVSRDIPSNVVAVGNPCKVLHEIDQTALLAR